jgi:hypothetical protein
MIGGYWHQQQLIHLALASSFSLRKRQEIAWLRS